MPIHVLLEYLRKYEKTLNHFNVDTRLSGSDSWKKTRSTPRCSLVTLSAASFSLSTFAEIAHYRLSFSDQEKQTFVFRFRLRQTNGSLPLVPYSVLYLRKTKLRIYKYICPFVDEEIRLQKGLNGPNRLAHLWYLLPVLKI